MSHVEEAGNQVGQGRFAGTARAHDRHHLAFRDAQVHPAQQRDASLIVKISIFEGDLAPERRQRDRARLVLYLRAYVEELKNLLGCADRLLERIVDTGQPLDRFVHFD